MNRRQFIGLISGAAAWPHLAGAQQSDRMRRVGVLIGATDDLENRARLDAFRQALQEMGWTDARNVRIDIRWGTANTDNLRKHAAELVAPAPDVILAGGNAPVERLLQVTRTVPIIFAIALDPKAPALSRIYRSRAATPPTSTNSLSPWLRCCPGESKAGTVCSADRPKIVNLP